MEYVTVGQLRDEMRDLPDDMPVMIKSSWDEYDWAYVMTVMQRQIEFAPEEPDPQDKYDTEPTERQCLILEDE